LIDCEKLTVGEIAVVTSYDDINRLPLESLKEPRLKEGNDQIMERRKEGKE
jgi:hypothetical protein